MTNKILLTISLACAALLLTQPARAERRWAYEYLDACEPNSADWPICEGYIEGYLGAIKHLVGNRKISDPYCLPEGISIKQIATAFKEFVESGSFNVLAMEGALDITLRVKFPCRVSQHLEVSFTYKTA